MGDPGSIFRRQKGSLETMWLPMETAGGKMLGQAVTKHVSTGEDITSDPVSKLHSTH